MHTNVTLRYGVKEGDVRCHIAERFYQIIIIIMILIVKQKRRSFY